MRTIAFVAAGIFVAQSVSGCGQSPPINTTSGNPMLHDAIPDRVVVILAERPDPQSHVLQVQDHDREGKPFIPIFRSMESFRRSTNGGITKPTYQLDRRLFVSMLGVTESIVLDPTLPDEIWTTATELKRIFPEPFDGSLRPPRP